MYDIKSNLIIGFHGCDVAVRDEILLHPDRLRISRKPYDWLGHGFYFWENNYDRAMQWAIDKKNRGKVNSPGVIGAVLQLGHCCDLLESKYIELLSRAFCAFRMDYQEMGKTIPQNSDSPSDKFRNRLFRHLDCAVIEFMHLEFFSNMQAPRLQPGLSEWQPFDSTRGAFIEGGPAFDGSCLHEKTHIQICIRNPNCIKGFFMPRREIDYQEWLHQMQNFPSDFASN